MKFPYEPIEIRGAGSEGTARIYRPMVPFFISGPSGVERAYGVADTGADDTVLPEVVMTRLGIVPAPRDHAVISGLNGDPILIRYARVDLELATSGESYRWSARVGFDAGHKVILGHQGFFDAFTASFNGRRRLLTLTPNGTAPAPIFGAI